MHSLIVLELAAYRNGSCSFPYCTRTCNSGIDMGFLISGQSNNGRHPLCCLSSAHGVVLPYPLQNPIPPLGVVYGVVDAAEVAVASWHAIHRYRQPLDTAWNPEMDGNKVRNRFPRPSHHPINHVIHITCSNHHRLSDRFLGDWRSRVQENPCILRWQRRCTTTTQEALSGQNSTARAHNTKQTLWRPKFLFLTRKSKSKSKSKPEPHSGRTWSNSNKLPGLQDKKLLQAKARQNVAKPTTHSVELPVIRKGQNALNDSRYDWGHTFEAQI